MDLMQFHLSYVSFKRKKFDLKSDFSFLSFKRQNQISLKK